MKLKKIVLISLLLIAVISLGSVAATDDVAIDTNSADNNEVQLAIDNNEVSTNDTQNNLGIMQNVEENQNSEVPATSTVNLETTNDAGNFTELQTKINEKIAAGETLELTKNYTRVTGDSDLIIDKAITIDAKGFTINGNSLGGIFNVTSTGDLTLKNAVIINGIGIVKSQSGYRGGGAIYSNGTVTVIDSTFTGNTASDAGGVIYNYGNVSVINSTFTSNKAASSGGVIYNSNTGNVSVINSTFTSNTANYGGTIANSYSGNVSVINSIFTSNNATYQGGVIYNTGAVFTVVNSNFTGNNASSYAIIYNNKNMTVIDSTFNNNEGGIIKNEGNLFINNITADADAYITNTGTINSAVVIDVLNHETGIYCINSTTMILTADVTAGGITVIGNLTFTVNNKNISATYNKEIGRYEADYTIDFVGIQNVTASLTGANNVTVLNASLFATTGNSFYDLNRTIAYAADIVDLTKNYIFDSRTDSAFINGIEINGNLIINGNKHTIIGTNVADSKIFVLNEGNFTFNNLNIAVADVGIHANSNANLTVNNVKFNDCNESIHVNPTSECTIINSNIGNCPIISYGILSLNNVSANEDAYIFIGNQTPEWMGTIESEVIINILNNESEIYVISGNPMILEANVTASGIPVIGEFEFTINNKSVVATYDEEFKKYRAEYTPDFIGIETVNAMLTNAEYPTVLTASILATTGNSFYDLNATIEFAEDNILNLTKNYTYDPRTDYDAFVNGIVIDNNLTINGNGYTIDGFELARIFNVTNTGNLTLINTKFISGDSDAKGGAIYSEGELTVSNSIFENNIAYTNGGAIYSTGNLTVTDSIFNNNIAKVRGGAIFNYGTLKIANSNFTSNNATYDGGAIESKEGVLEVINSKFDNNTSEIGGAIYVHEYANLTVLNSEFTNNSATNGRGGAIYSTSTKNLIADSTFDSNTATSYGGAIQLDTEKVVSLEDNIITNCIFNENVAGIDGSAIFTYSTVNVTDSTFTHNSVIGDVNANGGAIYIAANESLVDNCTFDSNYATLHGAAIYLDANNTVINNSRFYNNIADVYGGAILVYGNNNLISNCDFKYNYAPNGTVIGVYEGYNLQIVECINENNSTIAEIYLETNRTSLANVEVIVLGNETIDAVKGNYIYLSAIACSSGLNIVGGNLTFFDGINYYPAESTNTGIYASRYYVNHTGNRTITAQFTNAEYVELYTGAINGHKVTLTVNDVIMYYKTGAIVVVLQADDKPFVGESISIILNNIQYNLTTNEYGVVMLPIGLNPGEYPVTTIYNGSYGYTKVESNLNILTTIEGEDISLYYRNGTEYEVKVVNGYGQAIANQVVKMNINGVIYDRLTNEKGIATLPIGLNAGTYVITCLNPVTGEKTSNTITVLPTVVGEDLTLYYRNGSGYSAQVYNKDGSLAKHVIVTMNVNGVVYNVETDDNGIATLLIGLNVGEYIITTEYEGYKTSNKITVLPVLIGTDVTLYYRDGTRYSVNVLDKQGNPLSGVTTTMNINGIFYNVMTDASGIASLPIGLLAGIYTITTTFDDSITSNYITVLEREI